MLIDKQQLDENAGNLVVLGSHVTEMADVVGGSNSALYGRGFHLFNFENWSPLVLYQNLKKYFQMSEFMFLQLFTCFGGVIALYSELFKDNKLINPKFEDMVLVIKRMFAIDPFYSKQLGSDECRVLKLFSDGQTRTIATLTSPTQASTIDMRISLLRSTVICHLFYITYIRLS